jgi:hypothetical protein
MQDYPIVDRILVMSVSSLMARFDMNLYISLYYPYFCGNNRIAEISTPVIITSSRVDYLYWLTPFRGQLSSV